jgi:hypothetical protein
MSNHTHMIADERSDRPTYGAMFSIDAIKRANAESGFYFFSPDAMRFFSSRVLPTVYAGRFFITSERRGFTDYGRAYTVREFMPDGSIEEIGEFGEHNTAAQARAAIKRARAERHAYYFDVRHGKAGRRVTYVITASDPWAAMARLHKNARIIHCGRAADYMLDGQHADQYPKLVAA